MNLPRIQFYLPEKLPPDMPASPDVFWPGFRDHVRSGVYAWTVQTFLRLRASGFPCELTSEIPREGIMVSHRKSIPPAFQAPDGVLFVCLKADATFHPYANLHVVLNRGELRRWHPSFFMPHWPQPGLIPRRAERGSRFETAAFFGEPGSLAPEMRGEVWKETLRGMGLEWKFMDPSEWNDFSAVDVVVAVRSFDRERWGFKPPTKLYNAWHAGVPAILGPEPGYRYERKSPLDYIEVTSLAETIDALQKLRSDPGLRLAMVENGRARAAESDSALIIRRWQSFFSEMAVPAYEKWRAAPAWKRKAFHANGLLKIAAARLHRHLYTFARRVRGESPA